MIGKLTDLAEREKFVLDKEAELKAHEHKLKLQEGTLGDKEHLIEKEIADLEDKEFKDYMELQKASFQPTEFETSVSAHEDPTDFEIYSLLKKAHEYVDRGNLDGAKDLYTRISTMYQVLPTNEEKRRIYYMIIELKTDIELTTM